jgi:hypothetical protein
VTATPSGRASKPCAKQPARSLPLLGDPVAAPDPQPRVNGQRQRQSGAPERSYSDARRRGPGLARAQPKPKSFLSARRNRQRHQPIQHWTSLTQPTVESGRDPVDAQTELSNHAADNIERLPAARTTEARRGLARRWPDVCHASQPKKQKPRPDNPRGDGAEAGLALGHDWPRGRPGWSGRENDGMRRFVPSVRVRVCSTGSVMVVQ